jgi:Fe-S-cluster-containing hydrogenase component 2
MFIMRTGSATISRVVNGHETVMRYISADTVFGERGLLEDVAVRAATIRATVASEAIRVEADVVRRAIRRLPRLRALWEGAVQSQLDSAVRTALANVSKPPTERDNNAITTFLTAQGVGEATNAFIIDEGICIRCDNCEKACAATHDGISRVSREAGSGAVSILLPVTCRHCENPHCMTDCPVDAITRASTGEVFINQQTCIGCSNCANNCPYGAISMVDPADGAAAEPTFLQRLLQGIGLAPIAKAAIRPADAPHEKKAVKCDLCKATGNPACVDACPTGAAIRVSPEDYFGWLHDGKLPEKSR